MHGKPHPLIFLVEVGPIDSHNHPYWVVNSCGNVNLGKLSRFEKLFVLLLIVCTDYQATPTLPYTINSSFR